MPRICRVLVMIALTSAGVGCSKNILQNFAKTDTSAALYDSAMISINAGDYNGALTTIGLMTPTYAATQPVVELTASAYGGLCGLQFIPFVNNLSNLGGSRLLPFLIGQFKLSSLAAVSNCVAAEASLLSLGNFSTLANDDNFFLALIELGKMGQILSFYTDPTRSGSPDSTYAPCTVGSSEASLGPMTDADVSQIGVSINRAVASMNKVSAVITNGTAALASVSAACTAFGAGSFCGVADGTPFSAAQLKQIRSVLNEGVSFGLGTVCHGDITACACP